MKCAICKNNDASVSLRHDVNGVEQDLNVCQACADKHGLGLQLPIPLLTDFLFGVPSEVGGEDPENQRVCPSCHMHSKDLQKNSLLGCADCYASFSEDVEGMLDNVQTGEQHFGKVPRIRREVQAEHFKQLLDSAIEDEDFAAAAELRDAIAQLGGDVTEKAEAPAS